MVFSRGKGGGRMFQFFEARKTREQGRETNERVGRKEKKSERKSRFVFSFSFLRVHACFPPRRDERFSLLFFSFSLSHCETPQLGCRSRVSSLLLSLEISPGPATRQFLSPNSKKITFDEASYRCGRSWRKEDKGGRIAWGFNLLAIAQKPSRYPHPAKVCCPLKTS